MSPSLKARAHKSLRFSPSEVEAAVSRNSLILPNSAISMKWRNATRVADAGDEMSLEGKAVWLLLSRGMVFVSGCGCFAALVLPCFILLLGPIRRNTAHTFGTFVTFESVESAESVKVLDTFSRQVPLTFDTFKKDKRDINTFKRDKSS